MKVSSGVVVFLVYVFMVVFTFGHSYNKFPDSYESMGYTIKYGIFEKSIGSMMSSVVWPLYWSVRLQS